MIEPYLILHKVRGEPAFDIAILLSPSDEDGEEIWIIPTSGHRAYPVWVEMLDHVDFLNGNHPNDIIDTIIQDHWPSLPDHYSANPSPKPKSIVNNLLDKLGLIPKMRRT